MMTDQATSNGGTEIASLQAKPPAKGKKKTVEEVYQKKTQLEHILLRPDTYIGSIESNTEISWVYDKELETIVNKETTYVPGLYKIFDEILVNAADHKQRDPGMDTIKIEINQQDNLISIWNNGKGIPVTMHKGENMYVPTMIFGHLLTSSNYDDDEQKVTGGRNGFGAKLCNIFSTKFIVETSSNQSRKSFKQVWASNMSKASEPKIKESASHDFTKITFSPDLAKFKMSSLDDDIVGIMSRRAFDVAASTRGVKVFLNGKKVPVKIFKDYVDLYLKGKEDDSGNPLKCVYEHVNERWEVAIALSDKGFQHISFVNSIATTKGGRHVDYVADIIVKSLIESLKKKNKSGVNIKPFQVKNHMWVFVNALIVNPTFDSQTKENMTLQMKSFGSKCNPSEKFINAVAKAGITEAILSWAKFKQQAQLQSKCSKNKQTKLKGIPKLEDANDAGTRFSLDCTLILTEGDSAKTLAVAGLGVVGRDRYGVFPLKGKLLNVREASHTQILENAEINNLIKILGLQYKKQYNSVDDLKSLRYGKLMIMTDQDHDGSHIKGLLINFIHHNWPSLLKLKFLEEFITPIVKASKGKEERSFFSVPEYEEWKKAKANWNTYKIKYYKGLGTSTSKEAKEYFTDMARHRITFHYDGNQDDHSITMAFSKKAVEQRKEWLSSWMEECKRRKELGLPEIYLYQENTRSVNYTDFVNKELVLFSNLDNERSIPSVVDGFKPGQRKVLFTCMKRNDKREIKVAQLAGSVAEHSAYHHGEASLMSTIINLAQNYVGSNNINLLKPIGQFGTRLQGGKDAASPRYIFTQLSPLTRFIFKANDEALLNFLKDDNQKIEPEWYIPIIPMILVNGTEGIGTGWSTKVPNYNPREIIMNLKKLINNEEPLPMKPWFKNFLGTIEELEYQRYVVSGEISKLVHNKFEITELPIRTWTQTYKESCMEVLLQGTEKAPPLISDYREYHTDTTIRFVVTLPEDKVDKVEMEGPHKIFKLQTTMSLSSMVLFDHNNCLKRYNCVSEILREFYELRLKFYVKRKTYLVGMLEAEAALLSNRARFILEKCDGRLVLERKKKKEMILEMQRKGYDSDPVQAWKKVHNKDAHMDEEESESADEEDTSQVPKEGANFDYLLNMPLSSLMLENINDLLKKKDEKLKELNLLKVKTPSVLWTDDLDDLLKEMDRVEQLEREDESSEKVKKEVGGKGANKKRKELKEVLPSPCAIRFVPQIDAELKKKAEKAAALKEKNKKKIPTLEVDEFDNLVTDNTGKSLAARLGSSPDLIDKAATKKKREAKKTKTSPKAKKSGSSDDEMEEDVQPRQWVGGRRSLATKVKYNFSDEENEDSNVSLYSNEGVEEGHLGPEQIILDDSVVDSKKPEPAMVEVSDTDSEFEIRKPPRKKAPAVKKSDDQPSASQMFDSLLESDTASPPQTKKALSAPANNIELHDGPDLEPNQVQKKAPASKKTTSNGMKEVPPSKPAAKRGPKKTAVAKRKVVSSDSEDDIFEGKSKKTKAKQVDEDFVALPRQTLGRAKKTTKFKFSDSSENDFD